MIYPGVSGHRAGALYRVDLLLLDLEDPTVVRARSAEWALGPSDRYKLTGDVPGVVYPCDPPTPNPVSCACITGRPTTCAAMVAGRLDEILAHVMEHGRPLGP